MFILVYENDLCKQMFYTVYVSPNDKSEIIEAVKLAFILFQKSVVKHHHVQF